MQIYDEQKNRIGILTGFREREITRTLDSGDMEMSFEYPADGELVDLLKVENYIRTKTDEFVIKEIETSEQFNRYTAVLNVEELEGTQFPYGFESDEQTIRACLTFAFEGTGWRVRTCTVTKKRTIDEEDSVSAWDILQKSLSTYRCECVIDSINKAIDIYEQIGNDKGCYFVEGLNLRKLSLKADTFEFYTRIYPIGKDGITPEWYTGKDYIDNFQYSNKVKAYVWKDERYTNTTSLIEDATAKLEEMSRPYQAFTAEVADLAKISEEHKDILSYGIGDTVTLISKKQRTKEKQRIVKIVEYPEQPEKNTVEISNARKTFAQIQQEEISNAKDDAISVANSKTKKILYADYYTKMEVDTHITASEEKISLGVSEIYETKKVVEEKIRAANARTDERLTEYSTTEEMQSAIEMSAEAINLGVSKTYETKQTVTEKFNSAIASGTAAASAAEAAANTATDEKLKDYSTTTEMNAAIKLKADEISSEVKKKVNSSDFGTLITQNAYNVRVAFNNGSSYIQFDTTGITMYTGTISDNTKRTRFDYNGEHFYRDGYYVGKIGTNTMKDNDSQRGLVFDIENQAAYMSWSWKETASANTYTMKWSYCTQQCGNYEANMLHAGADINMHFFTLRNVSFEDGSITGTLEFKQPLDVSSDGTLARWGTARLEFKRGILISGSWSDM